LHAQLQSEAKNEVDPGVTPEVALQQQAQLALQSRMVGPASAPMPIWGQRFFPDSAGSAGHRSVAGQAAD
jgi:hypothetical protein